MAEIVQTKDRHGRERYGWRCDNCGHAAGAWPDRSTAEVSVKNHEGSEYCKRVAEKRKAAA